MNIFEVVFFLSNLANKIPMSRSTSSSLNSRKCNFYFFKKLILTFFFINLKKKFKEKFIKILRLFRLGQTYKNIHSSHIRAINSSRVKRLRKFDIMWPLIRTFNLSIRMAAYVCSNRTRTY